jgi:hypothetical protein
MNAAALCLSPSSSPLQIKSYNQQESDKQKKQHDSKTDMIHFSIIIVIIIMIKHRHQRH